MKMGDGIFWGLILIVIGLSIIFRIIFDISVFRVVIAVVFILIGIRILIGKPVINAKESEHSVVFGERRYTAAPVDGMEYNTVFGKTIYDFRSIDSLPDRMVRTKFNTVFGSTDILLPEWLPVRIKADAVFAAASMPNGNSAAFGSTRYSSPDVAGDSSVLEIEASVVFGNVTIRQ